MSANDVFLDTSAFYALMDQSDDHHAQAASAWRDLIGNNTGFFTTNYVLVESAALLQHRLGPAAVALWTSDILGIVTTHWIDRVIHQIAMELWLNIQKRHLSLVDCVSFVVMRRAGCSKSFCFDRHFVEQGFSLLPNQD